MEPDDGALIGLEVGGYVVERVLGRGGMGVVYAATHPVIGKRAAIKVLRSAMSTNPATVERFLREARSVNQIGHPNIVDIFAFGALPDGRSYLVMDLLEGEPLRKRVKRGRVPPAEAVAIIDEIASALVAAHAKGFIHRDLKPDNVFLVANPMRVEIKLLDFGLAKLLPGAGMEGAYRTLTGAQLGTPDYMSPEQLRGAGGVDHRTDIYALGILAFEILAQMRPHRFPDGTFDLEDGMTLERALGAIAGVPAELATLVDAMVALDPDQRPSLAAIRAELKRVRPGLGAPALSSVRLVSSELSLGGFDASALDAKPVLPTPPSGAPTLDDLPKPATPAPEVPAGEAPMRPSAAGMWQRLPPTPYAGLRAPGSSPIATRLGVTPAPARVSQPQPVAAARRPDGGMLWLLLGAALIVGATVLLVVLLS